ncbi:MAG: hypothetical protein ACI9UA_006336 [Pseudoalteromonas tetraodonis]|jgi:hypothetical protein
MSFALYLGEWKDEAWEVKTIDTAVTHRGSPTLAFDADGFPAVCYVANWDLMFARRQSDGFWEMSIVIAEPRGFSTSCLSSLTQRHSRSLPKARRASHMFARRSV